MSVSVDDIDAVEAGFKVSPNPTDGILNIELSSEIRNSDFQLELYRLTGERVRSFDINGPLSSIDIGELSEGMYFLKLISDNYHLVQQVELH